MYAAFISSYAGSNFDCTSMTNAELTAENRPAFLQVSSYGEKLGKRDSQKPGSCSSLRRTSSHSRGHID